MQMDDQAILSLSRIAAPHGVLSIYVGTTPDRQTSNQPAWAVSMRNALSDLRAKTKQEGPRERWVSLFETLDGLDLEPLLDPRQRGRGRAMFVPVGGGDPVQVALQVPLPDLVVLEQRPYLLPLISAIDEGRPAGIVVVDRAGVRVLDWRLEETADLTTFEFDEATGDWRQMRGPAPTNPSMAQHASSHKDRFEKRLNENRSRFLRTVADEVGKAASGRDWDRLVLVGDPRLTESFEDILRAHVDLEVLHLGEHHLNRTAPHEVADAVHQALREAQRRREHDLVARAIDRTQSGGAGTLGLRATLEALNEGRVAHLLFGEDVRAQGFRSEDGRLYADETPQDGADGLQAEPHLVERMVERAIETSAAVTPVNDDPASTLEAHDGVGALLRW